jgi:hypothetical protein
VQYDRAKDRKQTCISQIKHHLNTNLCNRIIGFDRNVETLFGCHMGRLSYFYSSRESQFDSIQFNQFLFVKLLS